MNRLNKKFIGRAIIILLLCLVAFNFGNGQEEVEPKVEEEIETTNVGEVQELEPRVTNLDVLLIDKINNSQIRLSNCVLVLAGELRICEDNFNYNNTFVSGDLYRITILVEPKNSEKN